MSAPNIDLINISNNSVLKMTNDQDFKLEFTSDRSDLEYEIYSNVNTGKYRSLKVNKVTMGDEIPARYEVLLPGEQTGLFEAVIRYKTPEQKSYNTSEYRFEIHIDPDWVYDAIVYNIFLRAYYSKGKENPIPGEGGTFQDVIDHMDELLDLGVNVIYLNPFHLIGELYRKYNPANHLPHYLQPGSPYSIKDPKAIDPEVAFDQNDTRLLLTNPEKQFRKLVDAAHKRGMRIIMDLVFNHTSHDFALQRIFPEWFLYKEHIDSAEDPYLWPEDQKDGKPWGDAKHTVIPYDHDTFSWTDVAQLNWEYMLPPAPNDPPPNNKKREMYEYFKSIPKYWIREFGVDGFRCDVAYKVPTDFWRECIEESRSLAKESYPENGSIDGEVVFIAESFHNNISELFEAGFTFVYGEYSNKIYKPINLKGYLDYMYNIGTFDFPLGSKWFIFPECHDFHRATSKLVPGHITDDDFSHSEKEEMAVKGNQSRWVLTATLPGMPMVFNGYEKVEWQPIDHVSYSKINWDDQKDIFQFIARVNQIRRSYLSLQKGGYIYLGNGGEPTENSRIFSFARKYDRELIVVAVNMDIENRVDDEIIKLRKLGGFDPSESFILKDLLTDKIKLAKSDELRLRFEPGQSYIFLVEQNWE